jgi:release factor glutamine methyltransferase
MTKLKHYKTYFTEQLSTIYPQTEIDTFFYYLIEEYLGLQRIDLIMQPDFEITYEKETLFNVALERLKKQEPIQYILGNTEFYGYPFIVNEHTLIPRPETEELVEWIITEAANLQSEKITELSILDIGTGTGCIPISIAKNVPKSNVFAIDVSKEALRIAKQNSELNKVAINFFEIDILKTDNLDSLSVRAQSITKDNKPFDSAQGEISTKFDIIVSNPPYVRELEKVEIKNNVLENEPHLALFVDDDNPLIFYKKIADLAKLHLTENGVLFFEINQYLGKETVSMLEEKGFKNIELRKDFSGNDRMIKANL